MKKEKRKMKNDKRRGRGVYCFAFFFLIFSFLFCTGCENPFMPEYNAALPGGKGSFSLTVNGRAILPGTPNLDDFSAYKLVFTPESGEAVTVYRTNDNLSEPIPLDVGIYNLVVSAYKDSVMTQLMARGTAEDIEIFRGKNTSCDVVLKALVSGGKGTFSWDITFSEGVSADMKVTPADADTGTAEQTVTPLTATGTLTLNSGRYNITFTLYKTGETPVEWHEQLWVYQNLESEYTHEFTGDYFVNPLYTITYHYNDGLTGDSTQSVLHGGKTDAPAPPIMDGYMFRGWHTDNNDPFNGAFANQYDFDTPVINSFDLYAKWEKIVLTGITAVYDDDYLVYTSTPLEDLKNGLTVTAHYSDDTTAKVENDDYTLDGDLSTEGDDIIIKVSYTEGDIDVDCEFTVNVSGQPQYGITLSHTAITFLDAKVGYPAQAAQTVTVRNVGYDPTGDLDIALSGTNASAFTLSPTPAEISSIAAGETGTFTITPKDGLSVGTYTATITVSNTDNDISRELTVSFTVYELTSITLNTSLVKNDYAKNEELDLDGLVVTAHYSNGSTVLVTGYTSTPASGVKITVSPTTVTISYADGGATKTAEFDVTVDPNRFIVSDLAEWNDALTTIRGGGADRDYTITIADDIAGITPLTGNPTTTTGFGTATGIKVTLTGSGTLDTSNTNGSMFYLGSGQKLVIDGAGLTLRGKSTQTSTGIIYIPTGATLELINGTITGNTTNTNGSGGGVRVADGTFNMYEGGVISGNTASNSGGGVYMSGGTFTMYGGVISGNGATTGGGIYMGGGTFHIVNGMVYGTDADPTLANTGNGAALYRGGGTAERGTFSGPGPNDGWVSKGTLTSPFNSTLRVEDGEIGFNNPVSNLAQYNAALDVIRSSGNDRNYTIIIAGDISGISPLTGAPAANTGFGTANGITVTLKGSGTLDTTNNSGSMFYLGSGQTLVIDGAGLTLRGKSTQTSTGIVYVPTGATLELINGTITGNTTNTNGSGGGVRVADGTFNMYEGGVISGNTASSSGGGVYMSGGTFTMYGGVISGNGATTGGGIYMGGGTFHIVNGMVYGTNESDTTKQNTATNGAALYRGGGTAQRGTFSGENGAWVGIALTSPFNATLEVENGNFVVPNSFTASSLAQYNAALDVIRLGGDNRNYTINITGNIAGITPVSTSTATTGFGTATGIKVTLMSSGAYTMDIANNAQGSMFRLGSGQTLIIDSAGLTLRGKTSGESAGQSETDGTGYTHTNNNTNPIIYVLNGATLELENGTLSGNTSSGTAGGVHVEGTFNMSGGEISGNTCTNSGAAGGGVRIGTNGIFTMTGGKISGNKATSGNGGGVSVNTGIFRIVNGTIYGTDANPSTLSNTATNGAALYINSGTAQRGKVDTNGEWIASSAVNLTSPYNSTLNVVNGEFYPPTNNSFTASNIAQYNAALEIIRSSGSGNYTINITGNITGITPVSSSAATGFGTASGIEVTLTSSGTYTMDIANNAQGSMFSLINGQTLIIDGAGLTLRGKTNGESAGTGYTHTNNNTDPIIYVRSGSTLELKNGTLSGNTAASLAGGVHVEATFNMSGGEISGNTCSNGAGGGVRVGGGGTFTMTGGKISGNTASNGGGVGVNTGIFRIVNGTIYGTDANPSTLSNTATNGAALYITSGTAQRGRVEADGKTWISASAVALTTPFNATLEVNNGEFVVPNSFTVLSLAQYNAALELIRLGGNDRNYTITIAGDIAGITPLGNTTTGFGTATDISVTLTTTGATASNPWTMSIATNAQGSMFRLGNLQKLVINGEYLTLQGRTGNSAAVIHVPTGATLELENGTLTGNSGTINGSGVSVSGGNFNMYEGGVISGNSAGSNYGGGVYLSGGNFTMYGGEISGNTAGNGGGVYVSSGTFRIVKGTIYGNNESDTAKQNTATTGAALYNGGTAQRGTGTNDAWVSKGSLTSPLNATLKVVNGEIDFNSFTVSNLNEYNAVLEFIRNVGSGNYTITIAGNISGITPLTTTPAANTGFGTATGISVTLTTTGATASNPWTMSIATNAQGSMFRLGNLQKLVINGEYLTLQGRSSNNVPIINVASGATLELEKGTISGNSGTINGSGVLVNGGTFNMYEGGVISGNNAGSNFGGGVYLSGGNFTMYGGEISGNTATNNGGGVYVAAGTFRIVTGTIYGTDESDTAKQNTATTGAALYNGGTAQRGTFTGDTWNNMGALTTTNNTLDVANGEIGP